MKKVSEKLLEDIKKQNVGRKVNFDYSDGRLSFPPGELRLKRES